MSGGGEGADEGGGGLWWVGWVLNFERSRWDGATKIEQVQTGVEGDPNFGHFVITW